MCLVADVSYDYRVLLQAKLFIFSACWALLCVLDDLELRAGLCYLDALLELAEVASLAWADP